MFGQDAVGFCVPFQSVGEIGSVEVVEHVPAVCFAFCRGGFRFGDQFVAVCHPFLFGDDIFDEGYAVFVNGFYMYGFASLDGNGIPVIVQILHLYRTSHAFRDVV